MDRKKFLKTAAFAPAMAAGSFKNRAHSSETPGLRRLSASHQFTLWKPLMEPAYHVSLGEVVIVEMSHGMPGLVTREGVFREPDPNSVINPQTGPIFIEGIEPGDSLAIDILDIIPGDHRRLERIAGRAHGAGGVRL